MVARRWYVLPLTPTRAPMASRDFCCGNVSTTESAGLRICRSFAFDFSYSGQWSCIAVEAEDLIKAIRLEVERQRREHISSARMAVAAIEAIEEKNESKITPNETGKKISQSQEQSRTAHKTAELFNTNRTYVNQAAFRLSLPKNGLVYATLTRPDG